VLERDPIEVDALELKDTAVVLTIVDGEVVFERPRT
jgi:predicted amidohydrolase YtcJ